jgi:hypothetical protein
MTWPIRKWGGLTKDSKFKMRNAKFNFYEPYGWMINDLEKSIKLAKANYLVALGLFCYSEIVGRHILRFKKKKAGNYNSFNIFVNEYMGYKRLMKRYGDKIYDWFRHGLCHEYYIKGAMTGVYVVYDKKTTKQAIAISKDGTKRFLVIKPYLRDFKKGIKKFLSESNQHET